jgi:hypothetical protein
VLHDDLKQDDRLPVLHKLGDVWVIAVLCYRAILYALDGFVDHGDRHEEPFAGLNWLTEPIFYDEVQATRVKNLMQYGFQRCPFDAVEAGSLPPVLLPRAGR